MSMQPMQPMQPWPTSRPAGAGHLLCVALWDLESCPIPAASLQDGLAAGTSLSTKRVHFISPGIMGGPV